MTTSESSEKNIVDVLTEKVNHRADFQWSYKKGVLA